MRNPWDARRSSPGPYRAILYLGKWSGGGSVDGRASEPGSMRPERECRRAPAARDWPVKHPRRYTGSFFQQSKVVVCGDAGSLGSGARGVIGRCCGQLLRSSHDWTARLTSRLGSKTDDRPGCIYLLLLPQGWAPRLDWTGAQTAIQTTSVLFVETTYKRIP
jgi:hypothetical protein